MTEEEKRKLARDAAASIRPFSHHSALIQDGQRDGTDVVQSALAAINALAPRLEQAKELLRCCIDNGHSYESEGVLHDAVRAFLNQGKPS